MAKRKRPLIGAHVSVAGGLHKGLDKALSIGAETIQIFGGPPVQWNSRSHDSESIEKFLLKHRESGLGPVFIHAIYLVNLASPNDTIRQKSVKSLADHLLLAQKIGAAGLVFHPGSSRGLPRDKALKLLVNGIKKIVRMVPGKTKLVLENTAGSGQSIGAAIGEIGLILKESGSRRLAVCLDTAHALQSGILDLSSGETVGEFLDTWNNQIGLDRLAIIHANDSKTAAGSHHDRHENIGEGTIGIKGFKTLARDGRLNNVPWILETPGFNKQGPDLKNIKRLKSAWKNHAKKRG